MKTTISTAPAVHDEDGASLCAAYAPVLDQRFAALGDFDREVLGRRVVADHPDTFEKIGIDHACSRENVRRAEARGLMHLLLGSTPRARVTSDAERAVDREVADTQVVRDAVHRLRGLELPISSDGMVEAGFKALDSKPTRLLLAIAKRCGAFGDHKPVVVEHAERRWLAAGDRTPERLVGRVAEVAGGDGVVTDLSGLWAGIEDALRHHVGSDKEAADVAAVIVDRLGLEEIGGQYAVLGGGIGVVERLVRILRASATQMLKAELLRYFPDRNKRTVLNALFEPSFVRVGRDDYALAEWGAKPRPQLRDLLYEELNRHGQVAVVYLADLAERHLYSRSSITFYSALPDVIEEGGVLRRRRPEDPPAVRDPGLDGACFRVVAGAQRGCWSCAVVVNHSRLYHSSQRLPAPIARDVKLDHGSRGVPISVNGRPVRATWVGQDPYLWGGELRPVLDDLGFADGEFVRLVVSGARELLVQKVPVISGPDDTLRALVTGACLYDDAGAAVPDNEITGALAYALGLDADTPLAMVHRRLASRHNAKLRQAFGLIFPEIGTK